MKVSDLFKIPQITSTELRTDLDKILEESPVTVVKLYGKAAAVLIRFDDMVDILAGIQARTEAEQTKVSSEPLEIAPAVVQ